MVKISARFSIDLPHSLLVRAAQSTRPGATWILPVAIGEVRGRNDEWEYEIRLKAESLSEPPEPAETSPAGVFFRVGQVLLLVSRMESAPPPGIGATDQGNRDFSERATYFGSLENDYRNAARRVANRLLQFLRHRVQLPGLRGSSALPPSTFDNPQWYGPEGEKLEPGLINFTVEVQQASYELGHGVHVLADGDAPSLAEALSAEPIVPLHRELLADARDAGFDGNLRRAVVELAVAAEVAVKQAFFSPESSASWAFEYLEEKRKVEVSVPELLTEPAKRAFGKSFKEVSKGSASLVEELFRCRNRVVHRGTLVFRDQSGSLSTANSQKVFAWSAAVVELLDWLEQECGLEKLHLDSAHSFSKRE